MVYTFSDYVIKYEKYLDKRMVNLLNCNKYCDCGSELTLTEEKTSIVCSNEFCAYKVAKRLVQMCKDLIIIGIGDVNALKIVNHFELQSPLQLLAYNPDEDGVLADDISMEKSVDFYNQVQAKELQLWEYLRAANIPAIRDNAMKIMKGLDSFTELFETLDTYGISFIEQQLGLIEKEDYNISAIKVFEGLLQEREVLEHVENYLNVVSVTKEISIVISRGILNYPSKEAFIKTLNGVYRGKVYINLIKTLSLNVDILLWEGIGDLTSKVVKAQKLGIPIMTSSEFLNYLNNK